jgi:putative effector of murein hydrolase
MNSRCVVFFLEFLKRKRKGNPCFAYIAYIALAFPIYKKQKKIRARCGS